MLTENIHDGDGVKGLRWVQKCDYYILTLIHGFDTMLLTLEIREDKILH